MLSCPPHQLWFYVTLRATYVSYVRTKIRLQRNGFRQSRPVSRDVLPELHQEMPTPAERKALVFLSAVIVLGGATRIYRSYSERTDLDPKSAAALQHQIGAVDSAIGARHPGSKRKKKGTRKGAPADPPPVPSIIDLDIASADQIETLRGIGPMMAVRIVTDRDSLGPFGSIDGFQRVKGIGPALAGKLAANVTFSGVPRPVNTVVSRRSVKKNPKRKSRRREEVY